MTSIDSKKKIVFALLTGVALTTLVGCDDQPERTFRQGNSFVSAYVDPLSGMSAPTNGQPSMFAAGETYAITRSPESQSFDQVGSFDGDTSSTIVSRMDNGDGTTTVTDENGREYRADTDALSSDDNN